MLAYHYDRAEAWEKALDYLIKSGDKAIAAFAPQQAVTFYERTLAVADRPGVRLAPDRLAGVYLNYGQGLFLSGQLPRAVESFAAMRAVARGAGDSAREGLALFQLALAETWAHRFEPAIMHAEEGRDLAQATGNQAALAGCLFTLGFVRAVTGDIAGARETAGAAFEAARRAGDPLLQAYSTFFHGFMDHWQAREEAGRRIQQGLDLGRRHQIPLVLLWTLWMRGLQLCARGDYDAALAALGEGLELSTRFGDRFFRSRMLNSTGWVYIELCAWETAIRYNREGAEVAREVGDPEIIRNAEINLGDCYLALG